MVDLFHRFRQKASADGEGKEPEESSVSSSSDRGYEKNRASGNHLMEQFDDLENEIACLSLPEDCQSSQAQKDASDKLISLQQNLLDFPASDQDLSQTDQLLYDALDFLKQNCIEELKKTLTSSDPIDPAVAETFARSAMHTILKILDTVLDYGINIVRRETSQEAYPVKLDNLRTRLQVARAEFVCSQCEKNIMIYTKEKMKTTQAVREISDTFSLANKAELATLKQTIRNLSLDIEDLRAKWNTHYELSLLSTDKDIIGLSEAERTALRRQQEQRLKEKAKQIEKHYMELHDHLNISKAVTDEAEKAASDLDHMFGGMLERDRQQEKEAQTQREAARESVRGKNRTTV